MNTSTPSPTWRKASPILEASPTKQHSDGAAYATGAGIVEEAAAAQPISLKQRGTRLSFLGGRRKESRESTSDNVYSLGDGDSNPQANSQPNSQPNSYPNSQPGSQRSASKENRRSFFRGASHEATVTASAYAYPQGATESIAPDWMQSMARKSSELVGIVEKGAERSLDNTGPKLGSVRKRLSMLKLGGSKKGRPNGAMNGVDEE